MSEKHMTNKARQFQKTDRRSVADCFSTDKHPVKKQTLLPGFEDGRYESRRQYDRNLFGAHTADIMKRDNRINIRVSGSDLDVLHEEALRRGVPLSSLLAGIVHDFVSSVAGPEAQTTAQHGKVAESGAAEAGAAEELQPAASSYRAESVSPVIGKLLRFGS